MKLQPFVKVTILYQLISTLAWVITLGRSLAMPKMPLSDKQTKITMIIIMYNGSLQLTISEARSLSVLIALVSPTLYTKIVYGSYAFRATKKQLNYVLLIIYLPTTVSILSSLPISNSILLKLVFSPFVSILSRLWVINKSLVSHFLTCLLLLRM